MSKRSTDLVKYVKFLVGAGVMEQPAWLQAVERMPPPEQKTGRKPPKITFPEDRLFQAYYAKYPEAKLEPVSLGSFEPPTARKFINRQMELIEQGVKGRTAFRLVEKEFKDAQISLGTTSQANLLDQVQREEETHLRRALREYNMRRGHTSTK